MSPALGGPGAGMVHTGHASYRIATYAQLVSSRLNVRRKAGGDIAELAALIRSQGLLQNLIGYEQVIDGVLTGMIEIVAGERRLKAVGMLIAAGDIPADFQITCLIVPMGEAIAISLAENSGREQMHPADTFEAMRELAARGAGLEDIALSFGVSALTVRRRLKLANVAPSFVDMYRDDAITFEQMAALAICDDHATQQQAWDSLDKWSRQPYQLRRLLTAQHIDIQTDRVAQFVGVKAFEAAGGCVLRDLFSDENAGFIEDAALLDRLAGERLAIVAKELEAEGWSWIDQRCRIERAELSEFARVRTSRRALTDAERAEEARIESELTTLAEESDVADGSDAAQRDAREVELDAQLDALQRSLLMPHPADRALAGALVTIGENGKLVVHRGLIRPADKAKMDSDTQGSALDDAGRLAGRAIHSERLMRSLTGHRTVALHAELMTRPAVALAVLAHGLIGQVFYPRSEPFSYTHVRLTLPTIPEDVQTGPACVAVKARFDQLRASLPADAASHGLLTWLLAQSETDVLELLAFCTGAAVDTLQNRELACPVYDALAQTVSLDMRRWWQPSGLSYLEHVTKARILEVVQEAVSVEATAPLLQMKRAALETASERLLADCGWLPSVLQTAAIKE